MEDKSRATLSTRLREHIKTCGPISFHDWMRAALYDERDGYYRRGGVKRWGREGDYRTSPERSPLFAATFARFFHTLYEELGSPARWTIWEAGAGAGHFAEGVLETFHRSYPHLLSATRYIIDETSADARCFIQDRLARFIPHTEYESLSDNSDTLETGIVFANELLDAFPVHRVTVEGGRLRELFVATDEAGRFIWTTSEPSTPRIEEYLRQLNVELAEGQLAEVNLQAVEWLKRAAGLFKRGYLILVDYGAEAEELYNVSLRPRGSLRAFGRHRLIEVLLDEPGAHDLTTTIDWTTARRICREAGLEIVSFERQDRFLLRAGLLEELERMTTSVGIDAASLSLRATAREMILPGGMSESFQVLVARR
ncbi:MAG TPA: SAM-dependent methyltransferase [Pyrinomonadaceae bacterium]|nr:SAM-dependent methyltransferase [Pyrinomonadaceae bacterium]